METSHFGTVYHDIIVAGEAAEQGTIANDCG
jgi:hypothetical protein